MPELHAKTDQRIGAIGRTRSGKTYLMERLLLEQPRVIVVDPKHRCNFPGYSLTSDPKAALVGTKVIYRPEGKVPDSFFDDCLTTLNEKGGGVLYIDEMAQVTSPSYIPSGLATIFRLGAELGVGCWWSAQAATEVHNTAIRQSDLLVLFLNIGASDRDKVIRIAGDIGEATGSLDLYEFVVYQAFGKGYDPAEIPVYKYAKGSEAIDSLTVQETEVLARV